MANGRTAHSRFKIPLELNNSSTCKIPIHGQLAEVLRVCKLIIWDESPMIHRYAFEALDRSLQDVLFSDKPFGGKVVLMGGDFRQILPVIMKGRRENIVNGTLCRSFLWNSIKVLKLTGNMRIQSSNTNGCNEFGS